MVDGHVVLRRFYRVCFELVTRPTVPRMHEGGSATGDESWNPDISDYTQGLHDESSQQVTWPGKAGWGSLSNRNLCAGRELKVTSLNDISMPMGFEI